MKTKILVVITFALISFTSAAQSLVEKANAEYDANKYADALTLYLQVAVDEGVSSDLYYNIGNTYYRMGEIGYSILYYERALLLNPRNSDARDNIQFVSSKIQTNIVQEKSFILQVVDDIVHLQSSDTWAVISVICFLLFLGGILLYVFTSTILLRKIGFFGGGIMSIVTFVSILCAFSMKSAVESHDKAIVVSPSVTLCTVPRVPKDKSEEAFILTAGNKVTVVDSVENKVGDKREKWYDVKADDTHRAWIKSSDIEII